MCQGTPKSPGHHQPLRETRLGHGGEDSRSGVGAGSEGRLDQKQRNGDGKEIKAGERRGAIEKYDGN